MLYKENSFRKVEKNLLIFFYSIQNLFYIIPFSNVDIGRDTATGFKSKTIRRINLVCYNPT